MCRKSKTNLQKQSCPTLTCRFIPNQVEILFFLRFFFHLWCYRHERWCLMLDVALQKRGNKAVLLQFQYMWSAVYYMEQGENTENLSKKQCSLILSTHSFMSFWFLVSIRMLLCTNLNFYLKKGSQKCQTLPLPTLCEEILGSNPIELFCVAFAGVYTRQPYPP